MDKDNRFSSILNNFKELQQDQEVTVNGFVVSGNTSRAPKGFKRISICDDERKTIFYTNCCIGFPYNGSTIHDIENCNCGREVFH